MIAVRSSIGPWSGFAAGPLAWAASTQANYTWVTLQCGNGTRITTWIAVAFACFAIGGAYLSWRSIDAVEGVGIPLRTHRFIAKLGMAMGILFTLVILFQLAATLIFAGCER
jgi:hypothetical protein